MKTLSRWMLAATLLAAPVTSAAQELRCPQGYESLPTPPGGEQRVLAACVQGPVQLVVSATNSPIAPQSPDEADVAQQIAARIGQTGSVTATPVRSETIAGLAARVSDLAGQVTMPDGTNARIEGMMVLIPAQGGTLVIMGLSRDPNTAHIAPAIRALVPNIAGLGSAPPAWRASATCPPGTSGTGEGMAANGMRRVARCQGEGGIQFEVLESRLPLRNEADARGPAMSVQRSLAQQLQMLGGSAQIEATQPFEPRPGLRGFATAIHGSANDPRAPAGAEGSALRIESIVALLPTTAGHVEIITIAQGTDAAALATMVRNFARDGLRLDGTGVPPAGTAPATQGDGGTTSAGTEPSPSAPPPQRRREIDLSRPLWDPGSEDRPRASTPAQPAQKSCGCRVPGGAADSSSTAAIAAWLVGALALASRRRPRSRLARFSGA